MTCLTSSQLLLKTTCQNLLTLSSFKISFVNRGRLFSAGGLTFFSSERIHLAYPTANEGDSTRSTRYERKRKGTRELGGNREFRKGE